MNVIIPLRITRQYGSGTWWLRPRKPRPRVEGSFCGYRDFGDGVLKYTKDGATYLDAKGKVVWVQSYEMRSPVVSVNGDFVAIGDQQGEQHLHMR